MEMMMKKKKNMMVVVGLLLIAAAFALPAALAERDFISHETVQAILKKVGSDSMLDEQIVSALTSKTVVSNPILEEALFKHSDNGIINSGYHCYETCYLVPCVSKLLGCVCDVRMCFKNSLATTA